ncbi:MAG: tRNA (adenosine(37)-N6)-threonylcarbamoyltransferase complex dimerization subunit type 1 TsaB [Clostridia bacterium]|nr:tRNA (adenosine(37)-N6)-threonylcarbamoyltransferase complex dimerization subunit type 1 TsaB [Clostridia bacterium]
MLVLGIDSSAASSSVCLLKDSSPIFSISRDSDSEHSVSLLPMIEETLDKNGIRPEDLDLIAPITGPGSFTGIRIGISVVKGLAFATGVPCIGISSLEAGAYTLFDTDCYICPILDARRNNVYTAIFSSDGSGNVTRITPDCIKEIGSLPDDFPDGPVYLIGDAIKQVDNLIRDGRIKTIPASSVRPWAFGAALCGARYFEKMSDAEKRIISGGDNLRPVYLRKTLPERIREEKINNG